MIPAENNSWDQEAALKEVNFMGLEKTAPCLFKKTNTNEDQEVNGDGTIKAR